MENLLCRFYGLVIITILFPLSHLCVHHLPSMKEGKIDQPGSSQGCFNLVLIRLGRISKTIIILYG